MIVPRLEIDHIDEWLDHLENHDVDNVYLWVDSAPFRDFFFDSQGERQWSKKPEANSHPEMSDDECLDALNEIAIKHDNTIVIDGVKINGGNIGHRQSSVINQTVKAFKESLHRFPPPKWLGFFDPDEFIVSKHTLKKQLGHYLKSGISLLTLAQKVFVSRWENKTPLKVNDIENNWGLAHFCHKCFFQPRYYHRAAGPHIIRMTKGGGRTPHPDILRFHHFRGKPQASPKIQEGSRGVGRYIDLTSRRFSHPDRSHATQFEA